jgi:hypothetical protein
MISTYLCNIVDVIEGVLVDVSEKPGPELAAAAMRDRNP